MQPDDADAIAAEIRRVAHDADVVLVIGGSSAGRSDHTAAVVARVGGLAVRGVAVRPGHPALLGYARLNQARADLDITTVPVIGIPGYPLAAAVVFELLTVPLLAALEGGRPPDQVWRRNSWAATGPPHPMSRSGSQCP